MSAQPTLLYTQTDEAPALATFSLLPIVQAFVRPAGIAVETRDISLAGRILAVFADRLPAIRELLETLRDKAPVGSQLVVEAEEPFDFATLWEGDWRVRGYVPAIVGILDLNPGHL